MTYLRRVEQEKDRAPIIAQYLAGELSVEGVRVEVEKILAERKPQTEQDEQIARAKKSRQEGVGEPQHLHVEEQTDQAHALFRQIKSLAQSGDTDERGEVEPGDHSGISDSERLSKVQAVFSRIETYRRFIEKKRADGEEVIISDREAVVLGRIVERCHTLLDNYRKKLV